VGFVRGFKARANRIAIRARASMGLAPTDPIDPFALCEYLEIVVIKMSSLKCDWAAFAGSDQGCFSAMTVPCGINAAIVHNDKHHLLRQRSNICHELAHLFLSHQQVTPLNEHGERNYDSGIEAEANFLSGCLLMPNEAAHHVVRNDLVTRAQLIYGVSKPMLEYRLRVSGATVIERRRRLAS
jgi:Zn-dependent peptidase ImmA (M78 family)